MGKKSKPVSSNNRNNAVSLVAFFLNESSIADIFSTNSVPWRNRRTTRQTRQATIAVQSVQQPDRQVKQHWQHDQLTVEGIAIRSAEVSATNDACNIICIRGRRATISCDAGKRRMPNAGMPQKIKGSVATPRTIR